MVGGIHKVLPVVHDVGKVLERGPSRLWSGQRRGRVPAIGGRQRA